MPPYKLHSKSKKKAPRAPKVAKAPSWDRVSKFPVKLFHTFRGPLIGHVDTSVGKTVRLWAPAMLLRNPQNMGQVIYVPLDFVADFVDMAPFAMVGTSSVPAVIEEGYRGYFVEFSKGSYMMKPLMMEAVMTAPDEAPSAAHEDASEPTVSQEMQPCPGCDQMVSNWKAHYPVRLGLDGEAAATIEEVGTWVCEFIQPELRKLVPNYTPPLPTVDPSN